MALSALIEHLMALKEPGEGGGFLVKPGMSQLIITAFPPNTQVILTQAVLGGDFAYIYYASWMSPAMVPNAFFCEITTYGNQPYSGVITSLTEMPVFDTFVVAGKNSPLSFRIVNQSNVAQYYEGLVAYVAINTPQTYNRVFDAVSRLRGEKVEALLTQMEKMMRART